MKNSSIKFSLVALILLSVNAHAALTMDDLKSNNIVLVTPNMDEKNIEQFLEEYDKFPVQLREEIVARGGGFRLIEGESVDDDPTWKSLKVISPGGVIDTKDGRKWNTVVGAGGCPYAHTSTRIVINHLYDRHGSANLVLHEHGHAMDSTYSAFAISTSAAWKTAITNSPYVDTFLRTCGDYCKNYEEERFAELFAHYYNDTAAKEDMEQNLPAIADFFKNLTSIKEASMSQSQKDQIQAEKEKQERRDQNIAEAKEKTKEAAKKTFGFLSRITKKGIDWTKDKIDDQTQD